MATSYIHNAIYSPEETRPFLRPHRRTDSSTSGATTLQGFSDHSHTATEPLLQYDALEPSANLDLSSQQLPHLGGLRPEWTVPLSLDAESKSAREHKTLREHVMRKRLKRLQWSKCLLETLITAFAVYNTVRYFMAYTIYESIDGQVVSLALGICTGTVFAFTACSLVVWLFQPYLLVHRVSHLLLLRARMAFHSAASFALFVPAVVNTALLFVWKNSTIRELNIHRRCHVDIDVTWSVSSKLCKPPAWGVWIVLSILRLVITIIIIIFYHWIVVKYNRVHRRSRSRSSRNRHAPEPSLESDFSSRSPPITSTPLLINPVRPPLHSQHQSSDSTLHSHPHSKRSSNHLSSPSIAVNSVHSDEEVTVDNHNHQSDADPETGEVALDDYHEHFRNLVSKINRETEEALALGSSDTANVELDAPSTNTIYFDRPRIPPTIGYDEFGRPYPPDEFVTVLNGCVRRMPTIESMGSREMGSSVYTRSDAMTPSVQSSLQRSRPPTRANTIDSAIGSGPSSRPNSITTGGGILLNAFRTTEMGELADKSGAPNVGATSTTGSSSSYPSTTMSYHTATSHGSATSGFPPSGTR